jgi:FdrA protein
MTDAIARLFSDELEVINVGVDLFAEALESQDVSVVRVVWRPPALGDPELADLIEKLGGA